VGGAVRQRSRLYEACSKLEIEIQKRNLQTEEKRGVSALANWDKKDKFGGT